MTKEEMVAAAFMLSLPALVWAGVWICEWIVRRHGRRARYRRILKERALDRYWRRARCRTRD